jgi:hypothetical protein
VSRSPRPARAAEDRRDRRLRRRSKSPQLVAAAASCLLTASLGWDELSPPTKKWPRSATWQVTEQALTPRRPGVRGLLGSQQRRMRTSAATTPAPERAGDAQSSLHSHVQLGVQPRLAAVAGWRSGSCDTAIGRSKERHTSPCVTSGDERQTRERHDRMVSADPATVRACRKTWQTRIEAASIAQTMPTCSSDTPSS